MIDINDAIANKEHELFCFLAKIRMPALDKIMADLNALRTTKAILAEMERQSRNPVNAVAAPSEDVSVTKPEMPAEPYGTMGDAAARILWEAGKAMTIKDIYAGVQASGFDPNRKSFRSLLAKDRRGRFTMLGGGKVKLSDGVETSRPTERRRVLAEHGFSLKNSVIDLLPELQGEFSQPIIYKRLRELNPDIAEHIQKASVSATLQSLVKDGLIRETYEGQGSDPKRYLPVHEQDRETMAVNAN